MRCGVAGEEGRRRGQGYGRPGASMVEVRNLHNGVEAEGEVGYGIRKDLASCMVRRRGYALDHSATMIFLMNKGKGLQRKIRTHIWRVVRHRDIFGLERFCGKKQEVCSGRKATGGLSR